MAAIHNRQILKNSKYDVFFTSTFGAKRPKRKTLQEKNVVQETYVQWDVDLAEVHVLYPLPNVFTDGNG